MQRHSFTIKVMQNDRGDIQIGAKADQPMTAEDLEESIAYDYTMTLMYKAMTAMMRVSRKMAKDQRKSVVQPTASVPRPL